jgi:hypothetical protein
MPGAFLRWRLDVGATDAEGRASAMLPLRQGVNDLSAVSFRVDHPDFAPWLSSDHPIDPPHAEVELERGAVLSVCGWIGERSAEVRDVDVTLDRRARLGPEDWARTGDGYPSTVRMGPGPYVLRLHHVDAAGAHWYSAAEPFELERGESRHLALELLPAASLQVVLDDAVPRPVEDGLAAIAVYHGDRSTGGPMLHQRFDAEIAPDGTFRFDALPAGRAQIIAMCRGWTVERVETADPAHLGLPMPARSDWERQQRVDEVYGLPRKHSTYEAAMEARVERTLQNYPDLAWILPPLELAPGVDQLRLAMQRTADVTVRVVDPDGAPIAGAQVSQGGETRWSAVGWGDRLRPLERFPTGPGGQVTLLDVPPWDTRIGAWLEGYVSVREDGRVENSASVRLTPEPGASEQRTLVLTRAERAGS